MSRENLWGGALSAAVRPRQMTRCSPKVRKGLQPAGFYKQPWPSASRGRAGPGALRSSTQGSSARPSSCCRARSLSSQLRILPSCSCRPWLSFRDLSQDQRQPATDYVSLGSQHLASLGHTGWADLWPLFPGCTWLRRSRLPRASRLC